jgi:hypothetical protein
MMLKLIRIALIVAGSYVAYVGYQQGKEAVPAPDAPVTIPDGATIKVISDVDKDFPPAPTGAVATASQPIRTLLLLKGTKEDAWKLACTFRGWSQLLSRKPTIKTTNDFQKAYVDANVVLLARHPSAGKWGGELNTLFDQVITTSFSTRGLTEADKGSSQQVKVMAWDANCSAAAEEAFNAISHQCFQASRKGIQCSLPTY